MTVPAMALDDDAAGPEQCAAHCASLTEASKLAMARKVPCCVLRAGNVTGCGIPDAGSGSAPGNRRLREER
jgi:hypothetical protein